jgi:BASS family bile acid:Na+ symporter
VSNPAAQVLLPAGVVLLMFALGTTLAVDEMRRVLARPRALAIGLLFRGAVLPVLALGLGWLLPLAPETAVGLVVIASSPANAVAALLTRLAQGNTMLAVTLSAAASLMSAVTVPLFVNVALSWFPLTGPAVRLPVLTSALGLFVLAALPVAAGMGLRHTRPSLAARVEKRVNAVGVPFVLVVIGLTVWDERRTVGPALLGAGFPSLLLNAMAVALALVVCAGAKVSVPDRVAIALESGLQNFAFAVFVSLTLLGRKDLMMPALAYGLVMWLSAIAIVRYRRLPPPPPPRPPPPLRPPPE